MTRHEYYILRLRACLKKIQKAKNAIEVRRALETIPRLLKLTKDYKNEAYSQVQEDKVRR